MSQKKLREFYSTIDEIADKEAFLETVRRGFKDVEDPVQRTIRAIALWIF